MAQEQQIKQLSIALAQTQWEARTFISKESQIQGKLEELRQEHSQRMYALRAECAGIRLDPTTRGSRPVGHDPWVTAQSRPHTLRAALV